MKPLSEWTLGEAKEECKKHELCKECPLYASRLEACLLSIYPCDWKLAQKPRICEVLEVEVGEKFMVRSSTCVHYPEAYVDADGFARASVGSTMPGHRICQIINGELEIIRKPRFQDE